MQSSLTTDQTVTLKSILVCDPHPIMVTGVKCLLSGHPQLKMVESASSLAEALDVLNENPVDIALIDKAFGLRAVGDFLININQRVVAPAVVVWGGSISEAETMHLVRAGARGVLLKTGETSSLVTCLRAVGLGRLWLEECMMRPRTTAHHVSPLTPREREVYDLVQHGLPNKQIAHEMGIASGTVKIHLKHIFEKTGVRGRHSLAFASMFGDGTSRMQTAAA